MIPSPEPHEKPTQSAAKMADPPSQPDPSDLSDLSDSSDLSDRSDRSDPPDTPQTRDFPRSPALHALRRGIALAFLITLFISRKLWLSTRDYPLTPAWDRISQPPFPLDHGLFWAMAAALAAVALLRDPRIPLRIVCAIGALWALLDQSRWQPYFIHYMVILSCFLALPFEKGRAWSAERIAWALLPARCLLAFTYLYSGLQKLNHQFVTDVFPWLVGPLKQLIHFDLSRIHGGWAIAMALSAACAEALGGLLLLSPRTQRLGALFLISMHGSILLMIGPFGYRWNYVIWPWNFAMMLSLWALFWRRDSPPWPTARPLGREWWSEVRARRLWLAPAVLLLFGVMPIFSFVGRWDSYPSFSLYSGSTCESEIRIDPDDLPVLPPSAKAAANPTDGSLDLTDWSIAEMNAIAYPEHRIAINVARSLARHVRRAPVLIELRSRPHFLSGQRTSQYFECPPGGGAPKPISEEEFNASH